MLCKSSIPMSPWVDTENASNKTSFHYKRVIQRNRISNTDIYHKVVLLLWGYHGHHFIPSPWQIVFSLQCDPRAGSDLLATSNRTVTLLNYLWTASRLACLFIISPYVHEARVRCRVSRLIAPKVLVPRTLFYPPESLLFSTSCSSTTRLVIY